MPLNVQSDDEAKNVGTTNSDNSKQDNKAAKTDEPKKEIRQMGFEEARTVLESEKFQAFLRAGSKHIESILFNNTCILEFMGSSDSNTDALNTEG